MNPKWHNKIKIFNAKIAVTNLLGLRQSKNSTNRKVSMHQCVVKIVERKLARLLTKEEVAVEDKDSLSQLPVQAVASKTLYRSNREAIVQFFAETVSKNKKTDNFRFENL